MEERDQSPRDPTPVTNFWRSATGITLIAFLLIAAILLGYQHRVHIFGGISGSLVFLIAWIGLHFFMHRGHGHGGHGGHGNQGREAEHRGHSNPQADPGNDPTKNGEEQP